MKYKNLSRAEQDEKELETLENEYRKLNSGTPPEEVREEPALTGEEETWKERYSNLRSYSDRTKNELSQQISELQNEINLLKKKPTESDIPSSIEEAREWVKKYPDLSSVLKTLMREEADFVREELGPKLSELEDTRKQLARDRAFQKVMKAHNDFADLIETPEFQEWVERQPEEKGIIGQTIYDALYKNDTDADAAIKAVNIYKQEQNSTKQPKKSPAREAAQGVQRTSGSAPSTSGGKRTFTESEIEKMSIWDYEKLEDQIDEAKREGRFEYDITGAAR